MLLNFVHAVWPNEERRKAVFDVNFMVKLLRACVWMPWLKQAMKDVANCDKPRGEVSIL